MDNIYSDITQLIGKTPLIRVTRFSEKHNLATPLLVKVESFNPGGSVKDRIALAMVIDAEKKGLLKEGATIIEPTSGNTGIGLALVGASRGYKVILTMPDTMSVERRSFLRAYGADVVLTEGSKGMNGSIAKAKELAESIENSFIPSQFTNFANVQIHKETTGVEIWNDTSHNVDIFVSGVGTGGTISGAGSYLKSKNNNIKVIAVEPVGSPVLSGKEPGKHKIQGIGAGFIPQILDTKVYDEIIQVEDQRAFELAKELAQTEGIFVGISSGAALDGAIRVAQRTENRDKVVVVLLPDSGDRYLSTPLIG
ncbi:MAG: cysteine synthase A [Sphaerochaetaceae bacterium]